MNIIQRLIQENLVEEDKVDTKTASEDEIVLYAHIGNFVGLNEAESYEFHEQWEIRPDNKKGRFRIRATATEPRPIFKENGEVVRSRQIKNFNYELTIKIPNSNDNLTSTEETKATTTAEAFEALKALSSKGMTKERFTFKVSSVSVSDDVNTFEADLYWEVDVFPDGKGFYHPWCKIDLEINKLLDKLPKLLNQVDKKYSLTIKPSKLPLGLTNILEGSNKDSVVKEKISALYDEYFLTKVKE